MTVKRLLAGGMSLLCLVACAHTENLRGIKREIQIPPEAAAVPQAPAQPAPPPEFVEVRETPSPLKTKIVNLTARSTPLQDVMMMLTRTGGLNLLIDQDADLTIPVTMELRNVTVEEALEKVFSAVPYFYEVKGNLLAVKLTETKIFELGQPSVIQSYSTDVGGDILGSAMASVGSGSQLKGGIEQKTESDKTAYNFWDVIEKSIEKLLAPQTGTAAPAPAGPATAAASAASAAAFRQSVTVNRMTGTIMVTANKRNLRQIEDYIGNIKKVMARQVLVEAKVIEVTLSDGLKFGIDWSALVTLNNRQTLSLGTTNFASVVPSSSPGFFAGTTASDLTTLLNALQTQGEVRTLSNPRVNILNGQTALLSVGTSVGFISSVQTTQTTTAGSSPTITYTISTGNILSGIMIGLVPHISESGEISLAITPIVSDLQSLTDEKFGTPDSQGNYPYRIQLPKVNLRQLSTSVRVQSNQLVVIGGLISKHEELTDNQVPILGSLPGIGYLFKQRDKSVSHVELVVMLRPVIISK